MRDVHVIVAQAAGLVDKTPRVWDMRMLRRASSRVGRDKAAGLIRDSRVVIPTAFAQG